MSYLIRPAGVQDLPALLQLEQQCFVTDRISPRQMRYLLCRARASTLVAETQGEIAGYLMLLLPAHPRPARLYSLAVARRFQRQGIGRELLRFALGYLQSLQYAVIRLEVRAGDQRAQTLYRQLGFVTIGQLAHYYADGEAALRMQRQLSAPAPSG